MLRLIRDLTDPLLELIKDDPVRPEIPKENRVGNYKFVASTVDQDTVKAMVCVSLNDFVPTTVDDLFKLPEQPTTAIFYTIWSYAPGAAAELLFSVVEEIKQEFPSITRFVTLSPKTEMAKRFHLKNGAYELQINEHTVNYEYLVNS